MASRRARRLAGTALIGALALGAGRHAPAAEHEGGGKGGASAYVHIEPMVVNLVNLNQYLQIGLSVKGESPEFADSVTTRMPFVRHELILLLTRQRGEELLTVQGKTVLMEELKHAINRAIKQEGHEGVKDVLIENFIVQ